MKYQEFIIEFFLFAAKVIASIESFYELVYNVVDYEGDSCPI